MKKITILIFVFILVKTLISQDNDNYWEKIIDDPRNFWEEVHNFESYINAEYPDSIPQDKLANIKDFYRFVNYWKSRLGVVDDELSYTPYIEAIKDFSLNPICNGTDPAQWELLGPVQYSSQYLGLVDEVLGDANDPYNYIIGSERGGIWKNQASGNTWVNVTDNLRLPGLNASEIIRNKFNPSHIIASTGMGYHYYYYGLGLIQSFDNGNTWEVMETFPYDPAVGTNKVIQDPNDNDPSDGLTLYVITEEEIYVSYNTGLSWTEITNPFFTVHNSYLDIEIADNGDMFISTQHRYSYLAGIYKYANGQWSDLNANNQFGELKRAMFTTPYGGKIFMLADSKMGNSSVRKIYKTLDYGTSWDFMHVSDNPGFKYEIEYSPASNIVYVGDIDIRVFKDDGSPGYKTITSLHADIRDFNILNIDNDGYEHILTATDGGVTMLKVNTQDINNNPQQENLNGNYLPIGDFIGLGVNNTESEFVVSGAVHCNSFRLVDGNWYKFSGGDGGDCEVNWINPNIYYYQANNAMLKRVNGNQSVIYDNVNDWFIGMEYELNPNDPNLLYFGRGYNSESSSDLPKFMIYNEATDDLDIKYVDMGIKKVGAIGVSGDNTIYAASFEIGETSDAPYRLYKSTDNGVTWQDLSLHPVDDNSGNYYATLAHVLNWKTIEDIVFNPINPDEMWISIGSVWQEWTGLVPGKFRVIHSDDAGQTFNDYSEGLTSMPVIAIEYQMGSNKRLFAGTDAGIYYREPGMAQWECFSEGMPIASVTDLDYDPCSGYLYASTTGRAIYKTPVNLENSQGDKIIPEETVWDTPKRIFNDISIPFGHTLTIESNVYMYNDAKIIVECGEQGAGGWIAGGKLIIDGGTITSGCNDFWDGIEVWGVKSEHQYAFDGICHQGQLILKNGATIEKAEYGAYMGRIDENGNPDPDKAGGIIQVIGNNSLTEPSASFINNLWGVKFLPYENYNPNDPLDKKPNKSYFNNAWFEANDDYPVPSYWYMYHVYLNGVSGIAFKGCTFTNQSSSTPQGIGIGCTPGGSLSTGFSVSATCTAPSLPCPDQDLDKCVFENLYKGIDAINTGIYTFTVEDAIFENNSYGIKMTNTNNASVLFSKFYIGQAASKDSETCGEKSSSYGIYMDNCTGFAIEENEFYKATGAPTGNYTGIRIAETQASDEIYKNYFEGLSYANYTEGHNWKLQFIYQGLAYICNINAGNYRDFDVEKNVDLVGGIQAFQGNTVIPAGNSFSTTGAYYNFYNNGNHPIIYYYCQPCPDEYPDPVYQVGREAVLTENACLSHYGGGGSGEENRTVLDEGTKQQREQQYAQALADYNTVRTLYDNLKDGGNTPATITTVETAWPNDMWQLRSDLLAKSPHLSLDVLKSTADKTDVFPDYVIFEIMAANPDELKKYELIRYLENKQVPLPAYMIDILKQVATGITYKTVLWQQMSAFDRDKTRAAHDMIRSMVNDTVTDLPELRNWLDKLGGIRANQQIIETYLTEENFNDALSIANMLPASYNLKGDELTEHDYYMDMLNLQINLVQQGRYISELDSTEVNNLVFIAENSRGVAGAEARGILEANYGHGFCDCLNVEGNQGFKCTTFDPSALDQVYGITLSVDPNPAKEWTAFNYTLPDNTTQGVIKIVDMTGRVMGEIEVSGQKGQHIWDTRDVKPGVYMYSFTVNGIVNSNKIVIQK